MVFRATEHLARWQPGRPVADQAAGGAPVDYGRYLRWRGVLPAEPPRRPQPARPSASAAARSTRWKYGLVASADSAGAIHLPPPPDDATSVPIAAAQGTVSSFTLARLHHSPHPPTMFPVLDLYGGAP